MILTFFPRTRVIHAPPEEMQPPRTFHHRLVSHGSWRRLRVGQFHMLITGRTLVAGNAITPDVSLVSTQVSVCIDNECRCFLSTADDDNVSIYVHRGEKKSHLSIMVM